MPDTIRKYYRIVLFGSWCVHNASRTRSSIIITIYKLRLWAGQFSSVTAYCDLLYKLQNTVDFISFDLNSCILNNERLLISYCNNHLLLIAQCSRTISTTITRAHMRPMSVQSTSRKFTSHANNFTHPAIFVSREQCTLQLHA